MLGVVPKSFLPNYKEFYEARWFAPAATARSRTRSRSRGADACRSAPTCSSTAADVDGLVVGVEICEDLWVPVPPSSVQALAGATVLLNLSASNEVIGKATYRRQLVANQSGRCIAGYVYAACGVGESTTDLVFGGHCLIAENGTLLRRVASASTATSRPDRRRRRPRPARVDRMRTNSFPSDAVRRRACRAFRRGRLRPGEPRRPAELRPRASTRTRSCRADAASCDDRCEEIFHTQVAGLAKRLEHIGTPHGRHRRLRRPRFDAGPARRLQDVRRARRAARRASTALTMPGFGTTSRDARPTPSP